MRANGEATRSSSPLFVLQGVSCSFGNFTALREIDLEIAAGERVALVGPSGAGKSTLLNLLNGALLPTKGEVHALGHNLSHVRPAQLRALQAKIGVIHQQFHLVGNLRVIHNVNAGQLSRWSLVKALASLIVPQETQTATQALLQVGIPEKLYERTDRLSLGQQQRVAIARTLVQQPRAILADEPIASLDPERSREIMDLLRDLVVSSGTTLVTSLHHIDFARSHFERIVGLRQGRILFDTSPNNLTKDVIAALYRI